jgi:limonene-1,2-epoxide hydrolase
MINIETVRNNCRRRVSTHALETLDMQRAEALLDENVHLPKRTNACRSRGKDATIATLKNFMRIATGFEVRMHSIAEREGVVLTERTDILSGPGVHLEFWVCGTFTVKNGKITEWKDYFRYSDCHGPNRKKFTRHRRRARQESVESVRLLREFRSMHRRPCRCVGQIRQNPARFCKSFRASPDRLSSLLL